MTDYINNLNAFTCDLLVSEHIPEKLQNAEAQLRHSCWWEYKDLHPVQKTLEFIRSYQNYRQIYTVKYINHKTGDYVLGTSFEVETIFPRITDSEEVAAKKLSTLKSFWKGRQAADEQGASYDLYAGAAFEKASSAGWKYLPRPEHMAGDRFKIAALDRQEKEIMAYTPQFENVSLLAGSLAPYKSEFDEWLYEITILRTSNHNIAFADLIRKGFITEQMAKAWDARASQR